MGKNRKKILRKILSITLEIKSHFPELYLVLDETPLIMSLGHKGINISDLEEYQNTLQVQLNDQRFKQ